MTTTAINYPQIGRALLHPTQSAILDEMVKLEGIPASPNELSKMLDEPLGNVSYHVRVLTGRDGGKFGKAPMLKLVRTKPRRGALEHYYGLTPTATVSELAVA